jgi:hypothetical protein
MTSKVDKRTGKVFVEKAAVLDDIIDGLEYPTGFGNNNSKLSSQSIASSKGSSVNHIKLLKEQQKQRTVQTEQIMQQNIQKSIDRENEKQERIFPVLLSNLDKATNFLDTIEKEINLHDETQKNKVRRQFEDWNTTVHGSIQVSPRHRPGEQSSSGSSSSSDSSSGDSASVSVGPPQVFHPV